MKEKILALIDKAIKNSKYVFPGILLVAVAVTVVIAMTVAGAKADRMEQIQGEVLEVQPEPLENEGVGEITEDIPLVSNESTEIDTLIRKYFNALAAGDEATLNAICDVIEEDKMLEITELSKYVEKYEDLEIFTKPGYDGGASVAYVCYKMMFAGKELGYPGYRTLYISKNVQGEYYLKFNLSDEENDYIVQVSSQADVVDMNNRVAVEYNDLMTENPDLLKYLGEVHNEVQIAMGVIYSQNAADVSQEASAEEEGGESEETTTTVEPQEDAVIYATAIATVNVRASDSQQSDKVGKATSGMKLQVLEQRVNGWSKVLFEDKEAFIKTEFLQFTENASGAEVIGTVTAVSNVNVRIAASESAERLGLLTGGDQADLLGKENGWCKINYNGKVGYVKEEFVQ